MKNFHSANNLEYILKKMECKADAAKTHQRRAENNEAVALCDSVHGAPLPLRGDGRGQLDGEDFIKTSNEADRFLFAPFITPRTPYWSALHRKRQPGRPE